MADTHVTRQEHLEWCKRRALEYCDAGDPAQAFASMGSDLQKHPETENHKGVEFGLMMMLGGQLTTPNEMAKFIRGFK